MNFTPGQFFISHAGPYLDLFLIESLNTNTAEAEIVLVDTNDDLVPIGKTKVTSMIHLEESMVMGFMEMLPPIGSTSTGKHKCRCELFSLMNQGCKCGGV